MGNVRAPESGNIPADLWKLDFKNIINLLELSLKAI